MRILIIFLTLGAALAQQPGDIRIDTQEWRDKPVRHLYIHGVMNGDTAFQVFMPARNLWKARLLQYLQGGLGGSEKEGVRMGHHLYALQNGAVYAESSQGHIGQTFYEPKDRPTELEYEATYMVTAYAKARCVELYGKEPSYSYIFGGSGGGLRSSGMLERFPKVYDGAVPVVGLGEIGFFLYAHSWYESMIPAILPDVAALADATRVPGERDPFSVLKTEEEKQALRQVLSAGFPRNSLWFLRPLPVDVTVLDFCKYSAIPKYFSDFWMRPEYAADRSGVVENITGTVKTVNAAQRRIAIDLKKPNDGLFGYTAVFTSGALKGQWRRFLTNIGELVQIGLTGPGIEDLKPGDTFQLDNRDLIAFRALYRHMPHELNAPAPEALLPAEELDVLREAGRPAGRFQGKMVAVFGTDDPLMWPTVAVRYRRLVEQMWGSRIDEHFRLYFLEHGVHGNPMPGATGRQTRNFVPVRKALDDLMAWVERGKPPVPGTQFSVDEFNQIVLPATAAARQGCQPLVKLRAVRKGAATVFQVDAEDPDNEVVRVEMDYDGDNRHDETKDVQGRAIAVSFSHIYTKPGTYFPTVRVTDDTAPSATEEKGIQNEASVRVVIE